MSDLPARIQAAADKLSQVVLGVCGQCRQNCCHQGTMMGSQGLRRLEKGLLLEADLTPRLREGLRARREELAGELQAAERVAGLLDASDLSTELRAELPVLQQRIDDLRRLLDAVAGDFPLTADGMNNLLLYSAVRSNLLRCLRQFPGAEAALVTFSGGQAFTFRGRKLAPPRCIFHFERCLAEHFKPIKCANFFCAGDPNLLSQCHQLMSFDEFVLANMRVVTPDYALRSVEIETELGRDYWEPKVFIGPQTDAASFADRVLALLQAGRPQVVIHREPGRFMQATRETLREINDLPEDANLVIRCQSVDGAALYELAVALDLARGNQWHGGLVLLAEQISEKSFLPHPLWEDEVISQPLGGLDIYYLTDQTVASELEPAASASESLPQSE
jgi:hypothetical protein